MPTYEYHCKDCGYTFELNSSISEKEKKEKEGTLACESCGSPKVEQLFGGFSIVTGESLKQSGTSGGGCCGGGNCC